MKKEREREREKKKNYVDLEVSLPLVSFCQSLDIGIQCQVYCLKERLQTKVLFYSHDK